MPAADRIRGIVKNALIKDGWTITADPFTLLFEELKLYVDLAAERLLALERGAEKIAVEIKTFGQPSFVYELHTAVGQFINYSTVLRHKEPDRKLFLAVSEETFNEFFTQKGTQTILTENHIHVIVVDLATEEVIRWIT
jgi:hypothetical protein